MDEPSTALDLKNRRRLIRILQKLPTTKIIATHDLDLVLETCDRVLVLNQGKLVADGSVQDILWNRKLLEKYNLELTFCLVGVPERFSEKGLEVSEIMEVNRKRKVSESTPKVQNVR